MAALDPAAIRARAHQIWTRNGKRQGRSVEDWVQAEKELAAEAAIKPPSLKAVPAAPPATSGPGVAAARPPGPVAAKPQAPPTALPPPPKPPAPKPPPFQSKKDKRR